MGRWDGVEWVPVAAGSVTEPRIHVITHGWGPGLRSVVDGTGDTLLAWHPNAETPDGKRFDSWFGPLADAILADDPGAAVLAYSWIDESATHEGATRSVRSQLRTTVNGQRLAVAVRMALGSPSPAMHFIGYSHGAKVATVAAALVAPMPRHLTILDSPDSLVPALGGALNNLGSYLRLLAPEFELDDSFVGQESDVRDRIFVDNHVSHFGTQYGSEPGLGNVVDVTLDPEAFPLDAASSPHSYAWAWYLKTAQSPELGLGYAWSPLRDARSEPTSHQYRQVLDGGDAFLLEPNPDVAPGGPAAVLRSRIRPERDLRRRLVGTNDRVFGLFWRRSGDVWTSAPVEWVSGPDDARVVVALNRTERAQSVKGWSSKPDRIVHVPVGGSRAGPALVSIQLEASEPAEVVVGQALAVNGFILPAGAERRAWSRMFFWVAAAGTTVALGATLVGLVGRSRRS